MNTNISILIAEDDEGHALLIKKNLERAGITNEMIHLKDGKETLEFFKRNNKDSFVLLLDIRMPKADGIEVLTWLKNNPALKKTPVIIITTTDDPQEIERCYNLGCTSYITKSINYDKFVESIRQLGVYLKEVEFVELKDGK